MKRNDEIEGMMELTHHEVPPYKTAFFIATAIGVIYLGLILFNTFH